MATVKNVNRFGKELTLEQMLRQFKKKCEKENLFQDMRRHDYYVGPSLKRKLKDKVAKQRLQRELGKTEQEIKTGK